MTYAFCKFFSHGLLAITMVVIQLDKVHGAELTAPTITVFAAASLKESLDQATKQYQNETGIPVRVSYAASSVLARQIEQGAPADVFFSADVEWMDYLQKRDKLLSVTRKNYLGNQLVLITQQNNTLRINLRQPHAIQNALGKGRLAVALTQSVPAGKYARAALESRGEWSALQPKLAEAENVRAAMMLVSRGEVPLGIVYQSDALADTSIRVLATFPVHSHPAIIYPVTATKQAQTPTTLNFIRWLTSANAASIFRKHGFSVLKQD